MTGLSEPNNWCGDRCSGEVSKLDDCCSVTENYSHDSNESTINDTKCEEPCGANTTPRDLLRKRGRFENSDGQCGPNDARRALVEGGTDNCCAPRANNDSCCGARARTKAQEQACCGDADIEKVHGQGCCEGKYPICVT